LGVESGPRTEAALKLLLDTNIFIPLEPATASDVVENTQVAARAWQLAQTGGHTAFLHPASRFDVERDKNRDRAELRRVLLGKYPVLPDPPELTPLLQGIIGRAVRGTNDWVDDCLLAALQADAVDLLISQDKGLRSKARRLGIEDRVLTLDETIRLLGGRPVSIAPPAVRAVKAHALPVDDPIWQSFREDYAGFDEWFRKCRLEHRQAWRIDGSGSLAAFCIIKNETLGDPELGAAPLKICSFKVAEQYNGFKYGELLLKTVFDYAATNDATGLFVTVFPKHVGLIELLEDFGFRRRITATSLGELVLVKRLEPTGHLDGLAYHIAFGPPRFDGGRPWFIVPIQPKYSDVLFPETSLTPSLFEGRLSFGNAIRKAYLCHSACRQLERGSVLVFFRTQAQQGVIAIGVVEDTMVSSSPDLILRSVARRTVYSAEEVTELCRRSVLAIRFRQTLLVRPKRDAGELARASVFKRTPQSIMRVGVEGTRWLMEQFAA
jgi:GNAT superfamily N-acetyltransferase